MGNYPPGAEYDSNAPYNEEDVNIEVYTLIDEDDYVYIDYNNVTTAIIGEDIHEYFSFNFYKNANFKYINQEKLCFEIKTSRGSYYIYKEDIVELFFLNR